MSTLSELIGRAIPIVAQNRNSPRVVTLSAPIQPNTEKAHGKYEADVFNFLLNNKEILGIKAVMKFSALLVDGAVELIDGRRLTVEVKSRMNWQKACQAEWQFRQFVKRTDVRPFLVDGGVVIFEEFQGDGWDRRAASRPLVNGWSEWYRSHADVDGRRLDLLRLHTGNLEGFPIGDVIVDVIRNLPDEEANKVLSALAEQGDG